jgi:hypothetical protein
VYDGGLSQPTSNDGGENIVKIAAYRFRPVAGFKASYEAGCKNRSIEDRESSGQDGYNPLPNSLYIISWPDIFHDEKKPNRKL